MVYCQVGSWQEAVQQQVFCDFRCPYHINLVKLLVMIFVCGYDKHREYSYSLLNV